MDPAQWEEKLRALEDELDHLDCAAADGANPVELDQSRVGRLSRMDALQGQAMNTAIASRRRAMRTRISQARARLSDGEFGFCVTCGEAIAQERLSLDPTVALCLTCAR